MNRNEKVTIYDIISAATDAGEWVNGEFEAIVGNTVAGQGRKPSKCDLCDPDNANVKVTGVWFGNDFTSMAGARVLISGQGIKAKSYRGNVEVTIGDKAMVQVLARGFAPAPAPAPSATGNTAPATTSAKAANVPPAATPQDAEVHFHRTMKKVALLYLHSCQYMQDIKAKMPDGFFTESLEQAAISSLFITAKDKGLGDRVPALRAVDPATFKPFAFVPPAKDTSAEEEKAKAAAKAAEEAAKKAEAERKRREAEESDIPF